MRFYSNLEWTVLLGVFVYMILLYSWQALEKKYEDKTGLPSPEKIETLKAKRVPVGFGKSWSPLRITGGIIRFLRSVLFELLLIPIPNIKDAGGVLQVLCWIYHLQQFAHKHFKEV